MTLAYAQLQVLALLSCECVRIRDISYVRRTKPERRISLGNQLFSSISSLCTLLTGQEGFGKVLVIVSKASKTRRLGLEHLTKTDQNTRAFGKVISYKGSSLARFARLACCL